MWKIVLSFKKAASVKIKRGRYRAKKPSPKAYQIWLIEMSPSEWKKKRKKRNRCFAAAVKIRLWPKFWRILFRCPFKNDEKAFYPKSVQIVKRFWVVGFLFAGKMVFAPFCLFSTFFLNLWHPSMRMGRLLIRWVCRKSV